MKAQITVDPCDGFSDVNLGRMIEACGLLMPWALELAEQAADGEAMKLGLADKYGFGDLYEFVGDSTVDADGMYRYPEDPPMSPLVKVSNEKGVEVLIYQHAILAIRDSDQYLFITRMD